MRPPTEFWILVGLAAIMHITCMLCFNGNEGVVRSDSMVAYGTPGDSITSDEYNARQAAEDANEPNDATAFHIPNTESKWVQFADGVEIADIRDSEVSTWVYDPNRLTDDVIRRLCESGRVCKVMGHQWDYLSNEDCRILNLDWPPVLGESGESRSCTLCGKTESRKLMEWQ